LLPADKSASLSLSSSLLPPPASLPLLLLSL
jgi:hypothetical protein